MIIDLILPHAGMGNQLFMYAAGLAVSRRLNTELALDTWGCDAPDVRGNYLAQFPAVTERRASLREIWSFSKYHAVADFLRITGHSFYKHPFRRILYELMNRAGLFERGRVCFEYNLADFASIPDNVILVGYFGSENFFADVKELVREKLKFAPECFNPEFASKIQSCNSVAIHIRRGDKVNNKGFLPSKEDYIRHSIEKISALTQNPKFFVFSDDIEWCKINLPKIYSSDYTFIENQTPQQDMALMTICKHVIMGPSTFSWWGAWLNENPHKIIIAPDLNLYSPGVSVNDDFLPHSWIRLE